MKKRKLVVFNADDFGLSEGTNKGILEAYKNGVLTSASMFATTPGFKQAVTLAKKNRGLGLGIHLSLTWGKSVLAKDKVNELVDHEGYFYSSYLRLIKRSYTSKKFLEQVEKEFEAQINKISSVGVKIDHINSQQHVHMIPNIYKIVEKLSKKYKVKYVRVSDEPFTLVSKFPELITPFYDSNFIKYLLMKMFSLTINSSRKVNFYGVMYTTKMNKRVFEQLIKKVRPGITEILSHPAKFSLSKSDKKFNYDKQKAIPFMKNQTREMELATLKDEDIKKLIKKNDIILTNYKKLL